MERNDQLIDDTVAYIRANPKEWAQDTWGWRGSCGTQACFAGTALLLSGHTLQDTVFLDRSGKEVWPPDAARDELGLTSQQSSLLFHGVTDLLGVEGLDYVISEIRAGRAETEADCDVIDAELSRRHDEFYENLDS